MYYKEKGGTQMLSLRLNPEDELLIREYARFNGMSVSEFLRTAALARIEDEYDLNIIREYEKAKSERTVIYYDHDEVWGDIE